MEKLVLPTKTISEILPLLKRGQTDSFVPAAIPGALLASRALEEAGKQHFITGYSKAGRVKLNILLLLLFHFPFESRAHDGPAP